MLDYASLRLIWWLLLGVLLIGFAITDGFDLGVAAIFRFLGRSDEERRAVLLSVEPVWEGNQVWLLLAGGAVFAAWPILYAVSFSGLYRALFLLLVALILRPVGFGFRNLISDTRWRNGWDWALMLAGAIPALLCGVAFGNLFLGIPFHFDSFQRAIYTGGFFNLLQPFALLSGAVSLTMLLMHGAVYAAIKLDEPMASRAGRVARWTSLVFMGTFIVAGLYSYWWIDGYRIVGMVDPSGASDPMHQAVALVGRGWQDNFAHWPWMWAAPIAALVGAGIAALLLEIEYFVCAFIASALTQAATILTAGLALFPFLLPSSSDPKQSLTVWNASSSAPTLRIMLWAALIFVPIVLAYTSWVFRVLRGRVTLQSLQGHDGTY